MRSSHLIPPPHTSDGAGGVECESGLKGPLGPTLLRLMAHMESSEEEGEGAGQGEGEEGAGQGAGGGGGAIRAQLIH